ncbi:hypothetical protein T492DRAFT_854811, partial [Pavlovales sp. CCMP2436]
MLGTTATREAESARASSRADAREARDGRDGGDAEADERRKRRERRRGLAWDKDAQGNTVAPVPLAVMAAGGYPGAPTGGGSSHHHSVAAVGPTLIQQQAGLTRRARRLHVSSLPPGCSSQLLRDLFNDSLVNAGLAINDNRELINDIQMDPGAKWAFLEFRSVREATSALALDGLLVLGRAIRVQRPNDFVVPPLELHDIIIPQGTVPAPALPAGAPPGPPPPGRPPMPQGSLGALYGVAPPPQSGYPFAPPPPGAPLGLPVNGMTANNPLASQQTASQISRKARRLHIGNLPQGMGITPPMLQQFFNATLVATGLLDASKPGEPAIDCTMQSGGKFAFVEFRTMAEAASALTLNNVEIAGRALRVERPRDYEPVPAGVLPELDRAGFVGETPICTLAQLTQHSVSGG